MSKFLKITLGVLVIIAIIAGTIISGQFFDIKLGNYVPYLTWLIALGIFFAILPKKIGKIIDKM